MGWLKTLFTVAITSFKDTFFRKRSSSTVKKILTRAGRPNSDTLFSTIIHGLVHFGTDVALKARDVMTKGWGSIKNHAPEEDVKREAETTYRDIQNEQAGIINKATDSFKDRVESAKLRTLKYIDTAFRRSSSRARLRFDGSKSIMQNISRFRPASIGKVPVERVNLNVGRATSAISGTRMPAGKAINIQDETGRAIAGTVAASMADHFESTKALQDKAARAVSEVTAESNKNITDNLERVLSATVQSNENLNRNLSELHDSLSLTLANAAISVNQSAAENDQKMSDSVSAQISESDEASSEAFKALAEQLYNNELSFAESHKEEMSLLSRTKTGLNQLIETISERKNGVIAAGASLQSLEGKVAELSQMPVVMGEKFNDLAETITRVLGLLVGRTIGSAYMGGVLGIAGIKTLMTKMSTVSIGSHYPFKEFGDFGNSLANSALRALNNVGNSLGISGLEDMLPQEIRDLLHVSAYSTGNYRTSNKDIENSFKKEIASKNKRDSDFAKLKESSYNQYGKAINKLINSKDARERAYGEGVKTLAFDSKWIKDTEDLLRNASFETMDTKKDDLTKALTSSLPAIYREGKDGSKIDLTKDIAFHGIESHYDLFSRYMNSRKYDEEFSNPGDQQALANLFNIMDTLYKLNPAAIVDQIPYMLRAIQVMYNRFPELFNGTADTEEQIASRTADCLKILQDIYSGKMELEANPLFNKHGSWSAILNTDVGSSFRVYLTDFARELVQNPEGVVKIISLFAREFANMNPGNKRFMEFMTDEYKRNAKNSSIMKDVALYHKDDISLLTTQTPAGYRLTDFDEAVSGHNKSFIDSLKLKDSVSWLTVLGTASNPARVLSDAPSATESMESKRRIEERWKDKLNISLTEEAARKKAAELEQASNSNGPQLTLNMSVHPESKNNKVSSFKLTGDINNPA